jgi:hypothetical protein
MLIEDMSVRAKITASSNSSNQETPKVEVKSLNIGFALDSLSQASIDITLEDKDKPYYLNASTYKREVFVGKTIEVIWDQKSEGSSLKELTLFKGVITGLRISKNPSSVSYSLQCSGGPLAFFNTSLAVKGWFPFGAWDSKNTTELFALKIRTGEFSSPKQLIDLFIGEFTNASFVQDGASSQATQKQAKIAVEQLKTDSSSIFEPEILKTYWGNVGKFELFAKGIRDRLIDLISQENSRATFWEFLLSLCGEIGVHVVPWIKGTMIIPDMLFADSSKNNVIFPNLMISESLVSDPFEYPDQIVMITEENLAENISSVKDIIIGQTALIFPEDEDGKDEFSPYIGNRYKLISPYEYRYLTYIKNAAVGDRHDEIKAREVDETRTVLRNPPGKFIKSLGDYKNYCQNFAEYYYKKIRSEKDVGSIQTVFQPLIAPGFPCYIIDGESGMNFRGKVMSVNHSISEASASTSLSVGNLVNLDEEITFKSPLWEELIPAGAKVGPQVLPQAGGVPSEAAKHVPYKEALDSEAMDNDEEAAKFTGRI